MLNIFYFWFLIVVVSSIYLTREYSGSLSLQKLLFATVLGAIIAIVIPFGVLAVAFAVITFLTHPESLINNPKSILNKQFFKMKDDSK